MINLHDKAILAINKSIKSTAEFFQKQPYYMLYETDIHCKLYNELEKEYNELIKLEIGKNKTVISSAVHCDSNVRTYQNGVVKPDIIIYPTKENIKVKFEEERRLYFPEKSNLPRFIIQIKLNRSSNEIRYHYRKEFLNDIDKIVKFDFTHAYCLFFDRSMMIDDIKYAKFLEDISKRINENKNIEIIYIGANIKDPENGIIRHYLKG